MSTRWPILLRFVLWSRFATLVAGAVLALGIAIAGTGTTAVLVSGLIAVAAMMAVLWISRVSGWNDRDEDE